MAKKILLFSLIFFFLSLVASIVHAQNEGFTFSEKEENFAKEITTEGKKHGMIAIREKQKELQSMIGNIAKNDQIKLDRDQIDFENDVQLKIFVSASMSRSLLKQYVDNARQYGATIIFRGLPEGSFRSLSALVYEILDGEEKSTSLQIDDTAFEEYEISNVPTFVLVKETNLLDPSKSLEQGENKHIFDKVIGNIGIRRALKEISENGELSDEATRLLNRTNISEEANE